MLMTLLMDVVNEITTTIRITDRFKKMLVIGHRGCGKSTILNMVAEDLQEEYHVVAFSAADVINMMDVEVVDILLGTYLQVLESVKEQKWFTDMLLKPFNSMMSFLKQEINIESFNLAGISLKFKVEEDSRGKIRKGLRNEIDVLQNNISNACINIQKKMDKDILIIIDDLDKLETDFAERIFYNNPELLILPQAKIIYTFPLDTYYCSDFIKIRGRYEDQFISLVDIKDFTGQNLENSQQALINWSFAKIS